MKTYAEAVAIMATAKDQSAGKKLDHKATSLIWVAVDGQVGLGVLYYDTVIVAYLPTGEVVLNSGGWHTQSTQSYIREYAPADSRGWDNSETLRSSYNEPVMLPTGHVILRPLSHEAVITDDDEAPNWRSYDGEYRRKPVKPWVIGGVVAHTPAKVWKCRTCHEHSGQIQHVQKFDQVHCKDLDNCHGHGAPYGSTENVYVEEIKELVYKETGEPAGWEAGWEVTEYRTTGCRLRRCYGHQVRRAEPIVTYSKCHRCKGTGKADYGSKPVRRIFLDTVIVNAKGEFLRYGVKVPVPFGRLPKGLEKATA